MGIQKLIYVNSIIDFGQYGDQSEKGIFYVMRYLLLTLFILVIFNIFTNKKEYASSQEHRQSTFETSIILCGLILLFSSFVCSFYPIPATYGVLYQAFGFVLLICGVLKMLRICNDTSAKSLMVLFISFAIGLSALIIRSIVHTESFEYNENLFLMNRISNILMSVSSVVSMVGFFWFAKMKQFSSTAYNGILQVCGAFLIVFFLGTLFPLYSLSVFSENFDNLNASPVVFVEFVGSIFQLAALALAVVGWNKYIRNY